MHKHNFCYNYGFLKDWMGANPSVTRKEIMQNMEMSDYNTLRKWIDGVTMVPLVQMMKFCNIYNVSIAAFFYDEFADETSAFSTLHINAKIEPANGWPDQNRKAGIKVCDPRTNIHIPSNMPKYIKNESTIQTKRMTEDKADIKLNEVTIDERMKFVDIIDKQNDIMLEMTRENQMLHEKLSIMNASALNLHSKDKCQ